MLNKKIFSIGIYPRWNLNDIYNLLTTYADILDSIYLSIPIITDDYLFVNASTTERQLYATEEYKDKFYKIIEYIRQLNIKIDLVLNNYDENSFNLVQALNIINKVKPEEITLIPEFKIFFNKYLKDQYYLYSFNATRPNENIFKDSFWNCYVLDEANFWKDLKDKNKDLRFLVNSGCPICQGCSNKHNNCEKLFTNELIKLGSLESYTAKHVLFPRDIELFLDFYADYNVTFKIGSRGYKQTIDQVDNLLSLYKYNYSLNKILTSNKHILLWRYKPFNDLHPENCNINQLLEEKQKLWEQLDSSIIY